MARRRAICSAALALILSAGCAWLGVGTAPLPPQGATYQGYMTIDGQDLWTTVRLAPYRDQVAAELMIRDGPSAAGMGDVDGARLYVGLEYTGQCAGRVVLRGEFRAAGSEISGVVQAADCTGNTSGSFLLTRRPADVAPSR